MPPNVGEVETILAELVETTPAEIAPNDRPKVCFRKKKSKKGVYWPTMKILCENIAELKLSQELLIKVSAPIWQRYTSTHHQIEEEHDWLEESTNYSIVFRPRLVYKTSLLFLFICIEAKEFERTATELDNLLKLSTCFWEINVSFSNTMSIYTTIKFIKTYNIMREVH